MPDPLDHDESGTIDSADIRHTAAQIAAGGVQSFSDGAHSVTAFDPEKLIDIADKIDDDTVVDNASAVPGFGLRFTRLLSPGGWS